MAFAVTGWVWFPYFASLHTGYHRLSLVNRHWDVDGMVGYRRNRVAGGTYFFTLALRNRSSDLLVRHISELRKAFRTVRSERLFSIDAIVVLPDHLHAIWTLPEGDADYSGRWRAIKACFTRQLRVAGVELARDERGEYRLWQRRFWEHTIRDERDFRAHMDYVHINPVKHGFVERVRDWPWSTFHRYVKAGVLTEDWAGDGEDAEGSESFGERADRDVVRM
jgi:putative transposase